jgi:hypothetical protein
MRVWIHPTRDELEKGYRVTGHFKRLVEKMRRSVEREGFSSAQGYHAVVVIAGIARETGGPIRTATKLLVECPLSFDIAKSWTWWVSEHPRPFIGLIAAERPLDKEAALLHFSDCGVSPGATGRS